MSEPIRKKLRDLLKKLVVELTKIASKTSCKGTKDINVKYSSECKKGQCVFLLASGEQANV